MTVGATEGRPNQYCPLEATAWASSSATHSPAPVAATVFAPAMVWMLWTGVRRAPDWFAVVLPVALVGYLGASRWVSFAFIPARLLFLLPFYLLLLVRSRGATRPLSGEGRLFTS